MKNKLTLVCFFLVAISVISAQDDGFRGYGNFEFITLDSYGGTPYINGGGGVIVNNNLIFGVYVSSIAEPHIWDIFTTANLDDEFKLSSNPNSVSTVISNNDVGFNMGLNISPAQPIQFTISTKVGYTIINFVDTYFVEDGMNNDNILTLDLVHHNLSFAPQIDLQFKIGSAFKFSVLTGWKIQKTKIRDFDHFPELSNLLMDESIFGGVYYGFGFTFGNL